MKAYLCEMSDYKLEPFYRVLDAYGITVTELAEMVKLSRSAVTARIKKNDLIDRKMLDAIGRKKRKPGSKVLAELEQFELEYKKSQTENINK